MRQADKNPGEGFLPSSAPLANPYVPFQMERSPQYEAAKGLVRGTLFPGLDLPFMGRVNKKELPSSPMSDLQAMAFAIQELALYLDTHSNDSEALELYRRYQMAYQEAKTKWKDQCGPLTHEMVSEGTSYAWLDDPWPWEYCANKEVRHVSV